MSKPLNVPALVFFGTTVVSLGGWISCRNRAEEWRLKALSAGAHKEPCKTWEEQIEQPENPEPGKRI